jgi:biotin transport system substrate-specific component
MSRSVRSAVLCFAFALLMAAGARLDVPMHPVPMTMQSLAVLLAGAVLGPAWGVGAVLIYLAAGLAGAPVLADGASGVEPFTGPTAGYLFAFPVVAALAGAAARLGFLERWITGTAVLFGLHLLLLCLGAAWLATSIGAADAWRHGAAPFLIGAAVKSLLALAAYRAWPIRP